MKRYLPIGKISLLATKKTIHVGFQIMTNRLFLEYELCEPLSKKKCSRKREQHLVTQKLEHTRKEKEAQGKEQERE